MQRKKRCLLETPRRRPPTSMRSATCPVCTATTRTPGARRRKGEAKRDEGRRRKKGERKEEGDQVDQDEDEVVAV